MSMWFDLFGVFMCWQCQNITMSLISLFFLFSFSCLMKIFQILHGPTRGSLLTWVISIPTGHGWLSLHLLMYSDGRTDFNPGQLGIKGLHRLCSLWQSQAAAGRRNAVTCSSSAATFTWGYVVTWMSVSLLHVTGWLYISWHNPTATHNQVYSLFEKESSCN